MLEMISTEPIHSEKTEESIGVIIFIWFRRQNGSNRQESAKKIRRPGGAVLTWESMGSLRANISKTARLTKKILILFSIQNRERNRFRWFSTPLSIDEKINCTHISITIRDSKNLITPNDAPLHCRRTLLGDIFS